MIKPEVVNKSLDDIRPYIEADGGYLEFVEIEYNLDEVVRDYYGAVSYTHLTLPTKRIV